MRGAPALAARPPRWRAGSRRLRGERAAIGHTAAPMHEDGYPVRILWGRVAALAGAVVGAFVLGLAIDVGGDDEEDLEALRTELAEVREERDQKREQLDALSAGQDADEDEDDEADEADEADEDDADNAEADEPDDDPVDDDAPEDEQVAGEPEPATDAEPDPDAGERYEVRAGDSLYGIAERFYGDGEQLSRIAEANGLDPSEPLPTGVELVIPEPED